MVLEATVLVLDNSEWTRNGDYTPNRFQAQIDAIHVLFNMKTLDNPENTVGVIAHAGASPQVLVSLTNDIGALLKGMHELKIEGVGHFTTGIQIAQLLLKHRANKNQRQRVIIFSASPLDSDEKVLVKLGKKLKKNNISVDVINIGEYSQNEQKLQEFVNAVDAGGSSQLITLPPDNKLLSESIKAAFRQISLNDGDNGGFNDDLGFDMDPNMDPELAMALRMSLEEEVARQRAVQPVDQQSQGPSVQPSNNSDAMDTMDEEEQIRKAIELSLQSGENEIPESSANKDHDDLVSSLIDTLPGVDPTDPSLQQELNKAKGNDNKGKSNEKDEDKTN
ncbi:hypothetical protein BB558_001706 [Smittium angustum]|uniref:VWFA domain-containing protein n=1 Tax=Smittium angustum TaxID=133377 RepID=A0A2U1JB11_SMIAN|nr:hypothetical protein BB558_001706 [Smittium angustum]